jgi:Trk K+ transport system NAD-binding subunit
MEPLLICIIGSFYLTNFTIHRAEFLKILEDAGPTVFVMFFTLTGASISLDLLINVWEIALLLFAVRIGALMVGSLIGGTIGGDPWRFNRIGWMPYITQAGVGLGLVMVVASAFPEWGQEFSTIIIAVIILSQLIGPPLFKWAIYLVGENHDRAPSHDHDGEKNAVIFGLEGQSFALARQLKDHGWKVVIASKKGLPGEEDLNIEIQPITGINLEEMINIGTDSAEAIITLLSDDENYQICEIAYENFGTKDMVVRLNDHANFNKFHDLGALIVEPSTAIVGLLDHLVRSPQAASLLLGTDENQDTSDIEILNSNLHGLSLRDLRAPADILVLSLTRGEQQVITHGYTRLRLHDILTVVGSVESITNLELRLGPQE